MSQYTERVLKQAVVEVLEERQLFASVALSSAGILTIVGDVATGNELSVGVDARGRVVATANGASQSFSSTTVKLVRMIGGTADDTLLAEIGVPAYADGGAGSDSIVGGGAADTLLGGAGNDTVEGAGGNDLIRGGDGDDELVGADGDDSLFGEAGNDTLAGGSGANVLDGGDGTNTLDGVTGVPTATTTTNPAGVKLTGTGFGTAGSWNGTGNTYERALDGNAGTYFDAGQGDDAAVGLDLGSARVVTSARFYPRDGLAWRMVGGRFEGSNDNANWTTLGTLTAEPRQGMYSTLNFANAAAYRYVRYVSPAGGWGNVAEVEFYGTGSTTPPETGDSTDTGTTPTPTTPDAGVELTGTGFGTAGSWNNSGNTYDKALDGDASTYFDAPVGDGAVVGMDLGEARVITGVRFVPRAYWASRMVGGRFEGSNDNGTWTTLATVTSAPAQGQYTTLAVPGGGAYRYVRYVSPAEGWGNVAEVEFYGVTPEGSESGSSSGNGGSEVVVTPTAPAAPTGAGAAVAGTGGVTVSWTDNATDETGFVIERSTAGGAWAAVGTAGADATSYVDATVAAGTTYAYRVRATNAGGESGYSNVASVTTPAAVVEGAPVPVLALVENAVTAGMAVHGNAIGTTLSSGSPLTARYEWDFGDPNGTYNTLVGFNAGHVYDVPGTYTVTLRVTDDQGRAATVTRTVTVAADARRTIYVDAVGGSDANDGTSPARAVRTANHAFRMLGNDTRILFARGQTFGVTESLLATYANVTIGAYGSAGAARPSLVWQGGTESWQEMISASATSTRDLTIENLTLGSGNAGRPNGIDPRGTNVTIRNCEFHDLNEAINCAGNPDGLLVQDNVQRANAGVTDYFVWLQGTNVSILGNTVGGGGMYCIRASGISGTYTGVLVAHNTFSNDQRSNLRMQKGSWVYVTGNTFNVTGVEFGPLGGGDGYNDPDYQSKRTSWAVLENNVLNLNQQYIRLSNGAEHVMIRNNAITRTAPQGGEAISIEGYDGGYDRQVSDVYIVNNTIVDYDTIGIGIKLVGPERGAQVTILNNLFVAPNLVASVATGSADVWINDATMGSIRLIAGNIWSAPQYDPYVGPSASVYVAGSSATGFLTPAAWESYASVQGDLFQNVTLGSVYQVTLNGVTAGANLARA